MFLAEPPPSPYDWRFRLGPFPIRVHPLFWLVSALTGSSLRQPIHLVMWVAVCFVSILVHELGHALAYWKFGQTARIVLYSLGGLAIGDGGWARSRMVNGGPRWPRWFESVVISAAGPCAGFLFAAFIMLLVALTGGRIVFRVPDAQSFAFYGIAMKNREAAILVHFLLDVNIWWGIVNLLPVLPLDGGQIARSLLVARDSYYGMERALWLSVFVGALVATAAIVLWRDMFIGVMFALLAVNNYLSLQGQGRGW